ncbi:hypothetical protein N7360_26770 [Klebsiella pneumoniae]|uniref:hypothetical protein n=1 Tax=Klebsiella pneumoniae TaxID=573 RepID=UPI00244AA47A|nr:hypothetical protein [Klebsiella pneumoniae]HDS4115310.1 hypothetical protein [Klebsiella pneumoniae subsp. pneumoniae]MDH0080709.1 hypothetical protein [Klebsiella pneumoniae]MDH8227742.1 hypothetical protein [Klebsiella pneumoniae]MDH8283093.1 hypothetical protein [Klebsiella pneumoniae]HCQ9167738.1 hypothetical protein [Klebsiella pneumoniae]
MTITPQAVNELIASLESAGELSIREQKFLRLAKAHVHLAAENVAMKSKGKELLGEACAVYSRLNKLIDPSLGDFVDGQTLHEFQFVLDAETPATDRIVAGIKADGVALVKSAFEEHIQSPSCYQDEVVGMESALSIACQVESQLREGADK